MKPVFLHELGVVCALGSGAQAVAEALLAPEPPRRVQRHADWMGGQVPVGLIEASLLPSMASLSPDSIWADRTHRVLLAAALQLDDAVAAAVARHGRHRVGIVLGTSTGGIHEAGLALAHHTATGAFPPAYDYRRQVLGQPGESLAARWNLSGPCLTVATACTSSALALLSARRLLRLGVCDVVVCGGVDGLADMPLHGFASLEALSPEPCLPFSAHRRGINIGEAAALFLMAPEPAADPGAVVLSGGGVSSDAHHMAAPRPDGEGARLAMQGALDDAGLSAADIHYLNLHGTATRQNDAMEARAVAAALGGAVPCSSTKPLTGHTLGAAGALEAAFCWLMLKHNTGCRMPVHAWDGAVDAELPALNLSQAGSRLPRHVPWRLMTNSFAFGGSNASLILERRS